MALPVLVMSARPHFHLDNQAAHKRHRLPMSERQRCWFQVAVMARALSVLLAPVQLAISAVSPHFQLDNRPAAESPWVPSLASHWYWCPAPARAPERLLVLLFLLKPAHTHYWALHCHRTAARPVAAKALFPAAMVWDW
jgi:hypothetical protein